MSRDKVRVCCESRPGSSCTQADTNTWQPADFGTSGLCGAVFIDEAFTAILRPVIGHQKWARMSAESQHRLLHDEWEDGIKPTFDGLPRTWQLTIPFECLDWKSRKIPGPLPRFTLSTQDVSGAFDPVVSKIRDMVDEQVAVVREKTGKSPKVGIRRNPLSRFDDSEQRILANITTAVCHLGGRVWQV